MPAQYLVIFSEQSLSDLKAISDYISEQAPLTAPRFIEKLLDSVESLEFLPHRYKVAQARNVRPGGVRIMPVASYLVYYRVIENKKAVRVLRVRHGARRRPR